MGFLRINTALSLLIENIWASTLALELRDCCRQAGFSAKCHSCALSDGHNASWIGHIIVPLSVGRNASVTSVSRGLLSSFLVVSCFVWIFKLCMSRFRKVIFFASSAEAWVFFWFRNVPANTVIHWPWNVAKTLQFCWKLAGYLFSNSTAGVTVSHFATPLQV